MTERELLKQLYNLKSVNPDQAWLKSNREILLAQISNSGAEKLSPWKNFLIDLKSLARTASRPAFALGSFLVILICTALFGHQAFTQIKPNDSLYIARVISERARLNTVFNEADRDQLALQFATSRAKDITTVLSDPSFNTQANQGEVAKLNQNFDKEIAVVKDVISRSKPSVASVTPAADDTVVSADSAKDNKGLQVYEKDNLVDPLKANTITTKVGTGTATSTATSSPAKVEDQNSLVDEAKKLFDNKEYNNALDKLNEVNSTIKK